MLVVLSFFLAPALDPKILLISFSQKLLLHIDFVGLVRRSCKHKYQGNRRVNREISDHLG